MGDHTGIEQRHYFQDHEIQGMAARLFDQHPDLVMRFMLEVDLGMIDTKGRDIAQGDFHDVAGPAHAEAMVGLAADWWEELRISEMRPEMLPGDFQRELDLKIMSKNGAGLQHIPPEQQTHELRLAAVSSDGMALSYIPPSEQTSELQVAAYRQNPDSLFYVQDPLKASVVSAAEVKVAQPGRLDDLIQQLEVQRDGTPALKARDEQPTHELATASNSQRLEVVQEDGLMLQHIPASQQSLDVQVEAVIQNEQALQFVPDDDTENVLREASLRTDYEPPQALDTVDPRVDFEAAGYRELSYREDGAPLEDYEIYFEQQRFNPMQADHLEEFTLRVNEGEVYVDFNAVDLDGNLEEHSITVDRVMAMEESPLKVLVVEELQGVSDKLDVLRAGMALDAAKAAGVDGVPIESVAISGISGYEPVASVKSAGSNEAVQIPLSPETLKPIHQEHQHLEDLIALQLKEEGATPAADLLQAQRKAQELADILGKPVAFIERDSGFEIELGDSDSKKTLLADNLVSVNQQLDNELIQERERSEVGHIAQESYATQHDHLSAPEPRKIYREQEVDQDRKRSFSI